MDRALNDHLAGFVFVLVEGHCRVLARLLNRNFKLVARGRRLKMVFAVFFHVFENDAVTDTRFDLAH